MNSGGLDPARRSNPTLWGATESAVRILKVVQAYFPFQESGGPAFKVPALARELVRRGHQISVLTADLGLDQHNGFSMNVQKCKWGFQSERDGVQAIYLPTWLRYRALTVNPRVVEFCREFLEKVDLVHFYGLYDLLGPAVSYFCRRRNIPYVIEPMGMYRPIDRSFRLKFLWHRSLGSAFLRNAAQIVTTSELEYQELLEEGIPQEKLVMRYNGIDPASFASLPPRGGFRAKWGVSPDEPLILFLSRLIPRKGADILIEAFAEVCPQSGRLVIGGPEGESGYRVYLEKRATECGVAARVLFTGPLYDEDKKAVLADADLFALPSRYENFANVAAEAMACGVPVIVSDKCGISSLVNGQAGLVIAPERGALAEALRTMVYDKVVYSRLKEGCRRVVGQLSWDHLAAQMEGHYERALTGSTVVH